jgi:hypothetical protein
MEVPNSGERQRAPVKKGAVSRKAKLFSPKCMDEKQNTAEAE